MRQPAWMGMAAVMAAALAGCPGDRPSAPAAPSAPEAKAPAETAAAGSREVTLEDAQQKQARLSVEPVRAVSLAQAVRANGRITVNENRTWHIGAVTEGRVIRILANVGDTVAAGQVLARVHSHDIHESRALYRKAVTDLGRAKSEEAFALRARDRARRLHALKALSLEQLDHAETQLKTAQQATQNAQTEVERTRRHLVEYLQIPVDETPGLAAGEYDHDEDLIPVKSPASGVVLTRRVTPGSVVKGGDDMFVISDLGVLWMIANVNEESLSKLRPGLAARVRVQAYPDRAFTGRIAKLDEDLDPATRTIKARIELPNARGLLRPEMYGTAEIEVGGSEPALFVPGAAPQEINGQNHVFVRVAPNRFEARPVELGRTLDGRFEVLAGLRAGEEVVSHGSFLLKSQLLKSTLGE